MKYGQVTLGQVEAIINKLGGKEVFDAILRGEKRVTVEDAIQLLFDKHGRRIPKGLDDDVVDPTWGLDNFRFEFKKNYSGSLNRLHDLLNIDTGVTSSQFRATIEALLRKINSDSRIANITNGVWLPIVIPNTEDCLGDELNYYLNLISKVANNRNISFEINQSDFCQGAFIVDNVGCADLLVRLIKGPVIGIYFPNPLQGYSIPAAREQMKTLPEGFALSGLDVLIAMLMHPQTLIDNSNTPCLYLAALGLSNGSTEKSFCIVSDDFGLSFKYVRCPGSSFADTSAGLFYFD